MRADRLLQILFLLRRHGRLPAGRLAERLEVSERTVLRDMEALSAAGVPVYTERGRHGGCVLLPGYSTDASGLTSGEAQALFAWASRAATDDLGLGPQLGAALTKLAATASRPALAEAEALSSVLTVDRRRWFAEAEHTPLLPVLREAAVARRRVRLSYASAAAATPGIRTIDPYGLVENAGRWYLLAGHRRRTRSYRVSRVRAATVLDDPAWIPPGFDLATEWARVRSRFEQGRDPVTFTAAVDPSALELFTMVLRSQVAPGGEPTRVGVDDGWPVLRAIVRARRAALGVLLGFGGQIRLREPSSLRRDLLARARATLALHPDA